ncbi:MAG: hypothetical protein ACK5TR_07450 [Alphaproteobacteria bacterium]|jgi:hypothetical protein|nr:hypothetical protein [Alphaproteobacteria bacterium]
MTSFPTFEELRRQIQKNHYASVPFPLATSHIQEAVTSFFEFLKEPKSIKEHMQMSIAPEHRRGDVGYTKRQACDHLYNDNKEFFHFHPALFDTYASFLNDHPVVLDFMKKALPVWRGTFEVMSQILKRFEAHSQGIHQKVFGSPTPHIVLRFLKYDWSKAGRYLAKPHFDAGSFTLGISESSPGLRIGKDPDTLRLVTYQEGHALFMLSGNVEKVMDSHELSSGWHDVIQLDHTCIDQPFSRWAVVAFIDGHGVDTLPSCELRRFWTEEQRNTS